MSEQLLIEQLDEAIDAIVTPASSGAITFTTEEPVLRELLGWRMNCVCCRVRISNQV